MRIERKWAMPNKWTFTIKPIRELLEEEMGAGMFREGVWVDPFAGENSPATHTNDLNPERPTTHHMDALDFLKTFEDASIDGVLLDPPYSLRQVSEHYKEAGIKVTGWHTSMAWGDWEKGKDASKKERHKAQVRTAVQNFIKVNPDYYKKEIKEARKKNPSKLGRPPKNTK